MAMFNSYVSLPEGIEILCDFMFFFEITAVITIIIIIIIIIITNGLYLAGGFKLYLVDDNLPRLPSDKLT